MVDIKELVVRASVSESPLEPHSKKGNNPKSVATESSREGMEKDIIESCVRQVLAILERQRER